MNSRAGRFQSSLSLVLAILLSNGSGLAQIPINPKIATPLTRAQLLDIDKPLLQLFRRIPLPLDQTVPEGTVFVPGDLVPVPLPSGFDLDSTVARIQKADTVTLEWEAELGSQRRRRPVPATARTNAADLFFEHPGILVPQLPRGKYEIFYKDGPKVGPKKSIIILPTISVAGKLSASVGDTVTLRVRLVGPPNPPKLLTSRTLLSTQPSLRTGLNLRPLVQLVSNSNPRVAGLIAGEATSERLNSFGQASFSFQISTIGRSSLLFRAEGFRDFGASITTGFRRIVDRVESPTRPFNVVVLGDSIQWGQGLTEGHKMTALVVDYLQQKMPGRTVNLRRYAHSGAKILPDEPDREDEELNGELPFTYPTVTRQAEDAADDFRRDTVDLVIMNGGANDIPLTTVLNPLDPGINDNIDGRTRTIGRDAMQKLLEDTAKQFAFRKATFLVTGYYPIFSRQSDSLLISAFIGTFVVLIWPEPTTALLVGLAAGAFLGPATRDRMADQCQRFSDNMTTHLTTATANANSTLLPGQNRIHFVSPGYGPGNAIYTPKPNTFLWTGLDDEMAGARAQIAGSHLIESPPGFIASIGHPNIEGATRYGEKLRDKLDTIQSAWNLALPRQVMRVSMSPNAVVIQAHAAQIVDFSGFTTSVRTIIEGRVDLPFSVTCTDATTGQPLDAYVYVGSSYVGWTNRQLHHTFGYIKDGANETSKPKITVSRQGYIDGNVSYTFTVNQPSESRMRQ